MGIPTLIFFYKGQEVERVVGALPKASMTQRFEAALQQCEQIAA